jgi:3-oxoacyl-[acyl-carrier-protein] synthase II
MSRRRVAITGLGVVSPYGGDIDQFFARLLAGESAIRHLATEDQPRPLSMPFVQCQGFDAGARLGKPLASMMDRYAQLGVAAAFSAWDDAGLPRAGGDESREGWGCIWGTALGGTLAYENGYRELWQKGRERVSPLAVVLGMNNAANAHISIQLQLGGVSMSHTVACASSAIAIGEAFRRVRSGEAAIMVTGGSEAPQAYGVARAWEALRVMAPGDAESSPFACRPFANDRRGLVLGEGGAALVLEDWEHALARGARIHGEIVGYATNCDHSHLVRPEAAGQIRALRSTLADAGLEPEDIDYVNAHGTATPEGDPVEIAALRSVFGERAGRLPVSATKSLFGHQLGAAGAIEAITTVLSLREGAIAPTANLDGRLDPACAGVDHVSAGRRGLRLRAALSNSFAFGGSNAVLAFRAA